MSNVDICLACGPKGSAAYNQCIGSVAVGVIPNCALAANTQAQNQFNQGIVNTVTSGVNGVASSALNSLLQPLLQALPGFFVKAGLFMLAILLLIVGMWILTRNPVQDTGNFINTQAQNTAQNIGTRIGARVAKKKNHE